MNIKRILCAVAAVCWLTALQIAFFWLGSGWPKCGIIVYFFYTTMSFGHVVFLFILEDRLGLRAAIGPGIVGSIIDLGQIAISLCFIAFATAARKAFFVELLIMLLYTALVALATCAAYGDGHRNSEEIISDLSSFDSQHQESHREIKIHADVDGGTTKNAKSTRTPKEHS